MGRTHCACVARHLLRHVLRKSKHSSESDRSEIILVSDLQGRARNASDGDSRMSNCSGSSWRSGAQAPYRSRLDWSAGALDHVLSPHTGSFHLYITGECFALPFSTKLSHFATALPLLLSPSFLSQNVPHRKMAITISSFHPAMISNVPPVASKFAYRSRSRGRWRRMTCARSGQYLHRSYLLNKGGKY